MLRIFIGYDPREPRAYQVCARSLLKLSSEPLCIEPLVLAHLRGIGWYRRPHEKREGRIWDVISEAPLSTEFNLTRFLVPALMRGRGWALYCDCDFLFRADVAKLFDHRDGRFAVMVVKQPHDPAASEKMDEQVQRAYPRKNWSSLMLFNCRHETFERFGPRKVSTLTRDELHGFTWLDDDLIGALPAEWNALDGELQGNAEPRAAHFTSGVPTMPGYENAAYADEWRAVLELMPS